MNALPGFRDFYPADCARRDYILNTWAATARRYGFVAYDGPVVESLELYKKKSGGELVGQLFLVSHTSDEGAAKGALRPEMTPTLARMVAARERDYRKPMKWFCAPSFFRHERQQRGRLREFYQLNCDILGDASTGADAELVALAIDMLRAFGFTSEDFVVRLSDRSAWAAFAAARGVGEDRLGDFLSVVDKLERMKDDESAAKLAEFGVALADVRAFIAQPGAEAAGLAALQADLTARGLSDYVEIDLTIVRGLAYYTGIVFEIFDRAKKERALAGGGRYDQLLTLMSDGKVNLPALGFGMGDVTLANLIESSPRATAQMNDALASNTAAEIYVIIATETRRAEALSVVQKLRDAGRRVDYALSPAKVGKQFQAAEQLGAATAIVVGEEWPHVKVKNLVTREEHLIPAESLPA